MTALSSDTDYTTATWKHKIFTLKSGQLAWQGAPIGYDRTTNKVQVMPSDASGGNLIFLGFADTKVDATSAGPKGAVDQDINVDLLKEVQLTWIPNAGGGDAVAATDVFKDCYWIDSGSVSITATGNPLAGRVWAVDTTKGVLVEKVQADVSTAVPPALSTGLNAPAFVSNDSVPADIVNGATYSVPATGAASTVTLPAAAADGTVAYFVADGTANANTVQYRDATGPANLTTALTASKRHLVVVAKRSGKWFANAYVSP